MTFKTLAILIISIFITACIPNGSAKPKKESVDSINTQYKEIIEQLNTKSINQGSNTLKTFISEYTYRASDDDSKNSARNKALREVKKNVLEEVGVYVESYLNIESTSTNAMQTKIVKEEIRTLTAGIAKVKILDEKWDGKSFYIKVEMKVDPDSVSRGITEVLKVKANQQELSELKILLDQKEKEVDIRSNQTILLQKKITNQELLNNAKQKELMKTQEKLKFAQLQLKKYKQQEVNLNTELGKIESNVKKIMLRISNQERKACLMRKGMTKNHIESTIGSPSAVSFSDGSVSSVTMQLADRWYYGTVSLKFHKSTLTSENGCNW